MKSRAATKGRRLFLLAAVCLLSALLVVPTAEASRSLPAALEPALSPPAMPDLVIEESDVEPQPRHRLFGDLSLLERPLDVMPIQKTASGVFALGIQSNIRRTGGLEQNRSGPTFQGLWTDPVTGIAYARNRWYDARTASWLSEDPMGDVDSPNLYAFVGWQPHVYTDPMGLYQTDFHYYAVYYLAWLATGNADRAQKIAGSSQYVDDFGSSAPLGPGVLFKGGQEKLHAFHFPEDDRNGTRVFPNNKPMQWVVQQALASGNDFRVGVALHSVADSYSHVAHSWSMGGGMNIEGINLEESHNPLLDIAPPLGHARSGTEVDKPHLAPEMAAAAGLDVYRVIREHVGGESGIPGEIPEDELRAKLEFLFRSIAASTKEERIQMWSDFMRANQVPLTTYDDEEFGRRFEAEVQNAIRIQKQLRGGTFDQLWQNPPLRPSQRPSDAPICGFWGCVLPEDSSPVEGGG